MKAKRMVYKDHLLPDTVKQCRSMLKRLIDKLEVKQEYTGPTNSDVRLVTEPFLRVPKVE